MDFFVHPKAIVEENVAIGAGTKVWAFAHILPGAHIGRECNICDNVFIEGDVIIGDRATIKCGVQLWNGVRIGSNVFVGPNATFTNDPYPRSKVHLREHPQTVLEDGCSIGANATILPGIKIGRNALVGAGAVVTKSVPPNAIVVGNPAEIVSYDKQAASQAPVSRATLPSNWSSHDSSVRGVQLQNLPLIQDLRGDLSVGEFSKNVPFLPKRYFMVFNVKSREIRGEHAHIKCKQFLSCISGSCRVVVDDGINREEFSLDSPALGLYIPPMTWSTQYRYSPNAILLVFASDYYDPEDYIRDYDKFLSASKQHPPGA